MKNRLVQKPALQQIHRFNSRQAEYVRLLSLSRRDLLEALRQKARTNPFLETTGGQDDHFWEQQSRGPDLREELNRQLAMDREGPVLTAARYIIDSLDHHGFYTEPAAEGAGFLHLSEEVFLAGLHRVQSLDPAGAGARSSMDAVAIQLRRKGQVQAAWMAENCQGLLQKQDFPGIARRMRRTLPEVQALFEQIRQCSPFPCSGYDAGPAVTRLPELTVTIQDSRIHLEPAAMPSVSLQQEPAEASPELRAYFQEARFFCDSLNRRNQTLMVAANALMKRQEMHLIQGAEKNPCTLSSLSEDTGLHISTLSRVFSGKYYELNGRILPFSGLFDTSTRNGSSRSAVMRGIQKLIEEENPQEPLQDEEISVLLEDLELYASRRTVAKYRSLCGIPGSRQRRRQYRLQKESAQEN